MISTFVIEIAALLYVLMRYKMSLSAKLTAYLLFFLALFQFAEYNVCEGAILSGNTWSQIGFASITMLPPLGLHLNHVIAGKKFNWLIAGAYLSGAVLIASFLFFEGLFTGNVCTGNYIIFSLAAPTGKIFGLYYYGWLIAGIATSARFAMEEKKERIRTALWWQAAGYVSFVAPTAIVNSLNPQTVNGIPSIMCGFAVIYAIILTTMVVPRTNKRRN